VGTKTGPREMESRGLDERSVREERSLLDMEDVCQSWHKKVSTNTDSVELPGFPGSGGAGEDAVAGARFLLRPWGG